MPRTATTLTGSLRLAALGLCLAAAACAHGGATQAAQGAPPAPSADAVPEGHPKCACKTPCPAHVEAAPCACPKGAHAPTDAPASAATPYET